LYNYRITEIGVNDLRSATWYWHEFCGDGTGFTLFGIPLYTQTSTADLITTLTDGSNVYNGSEISNNDAPVWHFDLPYNPTPGVITVNFHENDGICGSGQNGGVASFSAPGAGSFNFSTIGGDGLVSGHVLVEQYVDTIYTYTDTIMVYSGPVTPGLQANVDTFCANDSANLFVVTPDTGLTYEWYRDSTFLPDYTDSSIWVNASGTYYVRVSNNNGCSRVTASHRIWKMATPPNSIGTLLIPGRQLVNSNFPGPGFTIQWYKDGVAIPGANSITLNLTADGTYTCNVFNTNFPACSRMSAPFSYVYADVARINQTINKPYVYPNPSNGTFHIDMEVQAAQDINIEVVDMIGNVVYNEQMHNVSGKFSKEIKLLNVSDGIYFLKLNADQNAYSEKLFIK
jgi:hypothetical protein